MRKQVRQALTAGGLLLLAVLALPAAVFGLPAPKDFVTNLDMRCYKIPGQPPLGVTLRLDHLNPYFIQLGLPFEVVTLKEPQDLCVPVYKDTQMPPASVLPYIKFLDWKCYGISGPSLDIKVHLDQLNPVIANLLGPSDDVIVREPQQLCVPVYKNNSVPTVDAQQLVNYLDVKCYRIESHQNPGGKQVRLTHLNPLITFPPEVVNFLPPPNPNQLCVPVAKNMQPPPDNVIKIVSYSDVLCYDIDGMPLNITLTLTHLNPVLRAMGLPPEKVKVTDSHKLCVPVAKNGFFPPG